MEKPKDNESVGGLTDSDLSEISYPTEYDENEEIDEDPGEFKKGFSKRKLLHQRLQENKETYDPYLLPRPYEDLQRLDEDQILREGMEIDSKQALVLRISEFAVRKGTCFLFKRGQNTLFRVAVDGIALKNGTKMAIEVAAGITQRIRKGKWVWKVTRVRESPATPELIKRHEKPLRDTVPYSLSMLGNVIASMYRHSKYGKLTSQTIRQKLSKYVNVPINNNKIKNIRRKAFEIAFGKPEDNINLLPLWCHILRSSRHLAAFKVGNKNMVQRLVYNNRKREHSAEQLKLPRAVRRPFKAESVKYPALKEDTNYVIQVGFCCNFPTVKSLARIFMLKSTSYDVGTLLSVFGLTANKEETGICHYWFYANESKKTWTVTLKLLAEAFNFLNNSNVTFYGYADKGAGDAVRMVFPLARYFGNPVAKLDSIEGVTNDSSLMKLLWDMVNDRNTNSYSLKRQRLQDSVHSMSKLSQEYLGKIEDHQTFPVAFAEYKRFSTTLPRFDDPNASASLYSLSSRRTLLSIGDDSSIINFSGHNYFCIFILMTDLFHQERRRFNKLKEGLNKFISARKASEEKENNLPPEIAAWLRDVEALSTYLNVEKLADNRASFAIEGDVHTVTFNEFDESFTQFYCTYHSEFLIDCFPCECAIASAKLLGVSVLDLIPECWKVSTWEQQLDLAFPLVQEEQVRVLNKMREDEGKNSENLSCLPRYLENARGKPGRPRKMPKLS